MTRISHDQLMKLALQARFADFVRLFDPTTAAALDLDTGVIFRDTETFTDVPQGDLLKPDIVAEVRTREGDPGIVIVHVEIQRERKPGDFARRMWRYYIALLQREDKPVFPIALLFYLADKGVSWEVYEEMLAGRLIASFQFLQISLPRLAPQAEEYLESGNVLAVALAAIMGQGLRGAARAQLYYRCLQRFLEAEQTQEVNRAAATLLGDVVKTYLTVSAEDRAAIRQQVEEAGGDIMALDITELTWQSRHDLEVAEEVTKEVTKEVTMNTRREDIRMVVESRFGLVSREMSAVINATENEDELNAFFKRALQVQKEDDLLRPTES